MKSATHHYFLLSVCFPEQFALLSFICLLVFFLFKSCLFSTIILLPPISSTSVSPFFSTYGLLSLLVLHPVRCPFLPVWSPFNSGLAFVVFCCPLLPSMNKMLLFYIIILPLIPLICLQWFLVAALPMKVLYTEQCTVEYRYGTFLLLLTRQALFFVKSRYIMIFWGFVLLLN